MRPSGGHRAARDHCLAPSRSAPDSLQFGTSTYGRMFPAVPPLDLDEEVLVDAAVQLCPPAGDEVDDGSEAAGWPYFGQFIAHDITADRSPLTSHADVASLRNARAPRANLELVHGAGPVGMPYLYDRGDPAIMLTAPGGADLARNQQGTALIGDPRNDVHLFVASLQLTFLHAHNGLVERLRADGVAADDLFDEARRALRWHYQWIVVHDYLPRTCGPEVVTRILTDGPRFFDPPAGAGYIPLEFADAAFRYGHSQIRHQYRLTADGPDFPLFPDLMGFGPIAAEHRVDWAQLFDLPGRGRAQRAKRLDGRLPASLIALPHQVTGDLPVAAYQSLAVRDLLRGQATGLPAGEELARHVGLSPLSTQEGVARFDGRTPLWLYLLQEAKVRAGGDRLGPLGALIVAEVLIGLIRADDASWLAVDPDWIPSLPAAGPRFGLADLITFAESVAGAA